MLIYINSEEQEIPENSTMAALIQQLDLGEQRFAVEVNEILVPRSTFEQHQLHQGDRIEVVRAIGGG